MQRIRLLEDEGEEDEFLGDAVRKDDQGDAGADGGQQPFQVEAAAEKKQRQQKQKIGQAQKEQRFDAAGRKINQQKKSGWKKFPAAFKQRTCQAYLLTTGP